MHAFYDFLSEMTMSERHLGTVTQLTKDVSSMIILFIKLLKQLVCTCNCAVNSSFLMTVDTKGADKIIGSRVNALYSPFDYSLKLNRILK